MGGNEGDSTFSTSELFETGFVSKGVFARFHDEGETGVY